MRDGCDSPNVLSECCHTTAYSFPDGLFSLPPPATASVWTLINAHLEYYNKYHFILILSFLHTLYCYLSAFLQR